MTRSVRLLPVLAAFACVPSWADTVDARFPREQRHDDNMFTRMFPELPAFAPQTDRVRNAASLLGAKDGPLDARDNLTDPIQSIINQPVFSPNNRDSTTMTAGVTFFGQFLDHDITFDRRSALTRNADPARTRNFRTAAFDLDSVYGEGPERSAELYDAGSGDYRMRVDPIPGSPAMSRKGALRYDLPRDAGGDALVGDSRNDENVILSQFHVAMLKFHNAVVDRLRAQPRWQGASRTPGVRRGAAHRHLALPVVHRPRVPADDDRPAPGRPAAARARTTSAPTSGAMPAAIRCCRSSSRWPPTASATRRFGRATG